MCEKNGVDIAVILDLGEAHACMPSTDIMLRSHSRPKHAR
jgi:hypothetical protein